MRVLILIPVFNESKTITAQIQNLKNYGFQEILVVDDGSTDQTGNLSIAAGAIVLRHVINRGAGAATYTGICYAKKYDYDIVVTMDGDGQHDPQDVIRLLNAYNDTRASVIVGNRFMSGLNNVPRSRQFYNGLANLITFLFSGKWTHDSQSGFKLLDRQALKVIDELMDGFEFCSEILIKAHLANLTVEEIPIKVYYTKESMTKGQSLWNGLKTFYKLLLWNRN